MSIYIVFEDLLWSWFCFFLEKFWNFEPFSYPPLQHPKLPLSKTATWSWFKLVINTRAVFINSNKVTANEGGPMFAQPTKFGQPFLAELACPLGGGSKSKAWPSPTRIIVSPREDVYFCRPQPIAIWGHVGFAWLTKIWATGIAWSGAFEANRDLS